ncbi:MAG: DUF1080 domain-containing protein [Planctomycetota bacterium]|nr:DUF1080 domain-containing protein [Planctomycetota bacterium]
MTLRRAGSELPAGSAAPVLSGDTIVNPTESPAELALHGEDSRIALKPDSSLTLTRAEDGARVELLRGALHARLAPQDPRRPVRFVTPYGEAQVIGTELNLELRAGDARLEVRHGLVRVTRKEDGETIVVAAGQAANVGPGRELVALAIAGPAPGEAEPSTEGVPPGYTASPWRSIFDGRTLNGWQQDKGRWIVEDGALVATTEQSLEQAALMHAEDFADFELRFSYFVEGNAYLEFRDRVSELGSFQYSAREKNHTKWRACRIRIAGRAGAAEIDGKTVPYEAAGDISQPGKIRFYVQNRGTGIVTRLRVKDVEVRTLSRRAEE